MTISSRLTEWTLFALAAFFAYVGFGLNGAASRPFLPGPRDPGVLRVVTWNVGGRDAQALHDDWIPAVADTLSRLDADLVFLQEVTDADQLDRLRNALRAANPACRMFGTVNPALEPRTSVSADPGTVNSGADRGVAVLFQRGSLRASPVSAPRPRSANFSSRSPTPHRARLGLAVTYHPDDHPPVAAVVLHADAFSSKRRNRQIGHAVDLLMSLPSENARLLVGDLNLDLDLDKRRDLFSDNEHLDVESYNYIATHLFDVAAGTGSTADPDRRLDYIFADRHIAVVRAGPWKDRRTATMDHDPLVADLRFASP